MSRKQSKRKEARRQAQSQSPTLWRTSLGTMVIPAAVIVVAVMLAYLPALHGDFIWDDPKYVSENPILRDPDGLSRIWTELGATVQYYPLVFTAFWLEYRIWGLDTFGYHLINVLLHAASSILLWRVLRRLSVPGAWLAATIFALHPLQVESVAWITERKNVLAGFFYLAAALSYLHFEPRDFHPVLERRRWKLYLLALGFFLAALFSKTVSCSLPAAILLLVWWKRGRISLPRLAPLIPMFIVGGALARREGLRTWSRIAQDLSRGRLPAAALIDGVIVLIGGTLLLTPGFITDVVGLLTLIPAARRPFREYLKRRFQHSVKIKPFGFPAPPGQPEIQDPDDWEDITRD